jgi:thiamine biosynthesis lipoprotein
MTQAEPAVHRFSHLAMGTFFEAAIAGEEESYAGQAAQAVFHEIDRLENLFSRFNPTSEICLINRLGPGESMLIGVETYECLTIAEQVRNETRGAFDAGVRLKVKYRSPRFSELPGDEEFPHFELLETGGRFAIRIALGENLLARNVDLDLGAIGKGYALDIALTVLDDWNIVNALLHAGTSTAIALGTAPGLAPNEFGWPVGVGGGWPCPDAPRRILLSERALSGSGTEVKGQHILDPRTGGPAQGHQAAWVYHPSAAVSDALSTAFMAMSTDEVGEFCRRHEDVWALVVKDYGECRVFPGANTVL